MSADTVTRALKRHTRAAGLAAITPHVMRATYITLARQAGADLADVQYSVGHSDPKTTLRYDRSKGALDRAPVYQLPLRERGLRPASIAR